MKLLCIEAPCCYQDPRPKLVWDIARATHVCEGCSRVYPAEAITKLRGGVMTDPASMNPILQPSPMKPVEQDKREFHLVMSRTQRNLLEFALEAEIDRYADDGMTIEKDSLFAIFAQVRKQHENF